MDKKITRLDCFLSSNQIVSTRKLIFILGLLISTSSFARTKLVGKVTDSKTGEVLTGATIVLFSTTSPSATQLSAISGLDGSYQVQIKSTGTYQINVTYVGYKPVVKTLEVTGNSPDVTTMNFSLDGQSNVLLEVVVSEEIKGTDVQARMIEKLSPNVVNVISSRQIELSPDITVANVIQRVSGLSIERNASGDPQYAIVRGMDKRYNNTLVNGIKIPSPDNENRYVPLDIFPAVFLERLEVYKSLTANMEADAIGGTVNMVMKNAPNKKVIAGDFQIGYNQMNFTRPFGTYDRSNLARRSPKEINGEGYRATPADFPVENMILKNVTPLPDVFANLTYGNRFKNNKLGVVVGGSFQNSYRPVSNFFYDPGVSNLPGNPQLMRQLIERETSSQLQRIAFHSRLDYTLNNRTSFNLYVGQYMLNEFRVRDQVRRESFVATDNYAVYPITRFSNIFQSITTIDFGGKHSLTEKLEANWNVVASRAKNDRPDDGVFARAGTFNREQNEIIAESVYFQGVRNSRAWERNTDTDISAYFNFKYKPGFINDKTEFQFGGVARNKIRDNYFNYYNYQQIIGQTKGVDWNNFGEVRFPGMANPLGSGDRSNLVYDANEQILAAYVNSVWEYKTLNVQAGLRMEHTVQGYEINTLSASFDLVDPTSEQSYTNLFPAISLKNSLTSKSLLKATYFKGISRPGFYEIVPIIRADGGGDSFFSERGNADLKPSIGHSADLRYEFFPSGVNQILAGVFFKKIIDPIEYGFPQVVPGEPARTDRILPQNFDDAINFGIEADYTQYFNRLGIRFNYTYTNSQITTNKIVLTPDGTPDVVNQTRPLQGQSNHIGNLSLLWKDQKNTLDVQVVLNYTGERIAFVSPYLGADHYMLPMTQLDFSVEKGIKAGWIIFAKINNILNTPYQLYVKKPLAVPEGAFPYQEDPYNIGNVRQDIYGQSFRLGVRYNFINKTQ